MKLILHLFEKMLCTHLVLYWFSSLQAKYLSLQNSLLNLPAKASLAASASASLEPRSQRAFRKSQPSPRPQ